MLFLQTHLISYEPYHHIGQFSLRDVMSLTLGVLGIVHASFYPDEILAKGLIMNQQDILNKLSGLKGNIQHLINKKMHRSSDTDEVEVLEDGADNYIDDLPLTLSRDSKPGVKFYATENADVARGANKEPARGIDNFDNYQSNPSH